MEEWSEKCSKILFKYNVKVPKVLLTEGTFLSLSDNLYFCVDFGTQFYFI